MRANAALEGGRYAEAVSLFREVLARYQLIAECFRGYVGISITADKPQQRYVVHLRQLRV